MRGFIILMSSVEPGVVSLHNGTMRNHVKHEDIDFDHFMARMSSNISTKNELTTERKGPLVGFRSVPMPVFREARIRLAILLMRALQSSGNPHF